MVGFWLMTPLLRAIEVSPETFDDLEVSMLFLETDFSDFRQKMIQLGEDRRTFSLIFVMDDMGETDAQKKIRLRQLKAVREDPKLREIVTKITVKGKPGEQSIKPNVFSSDVAFLADNG